MSASGSAAAAGAVCEYFARHLTTAMPPASLIHRVYSVSLIVLLVLLAYSSPARADNRTLTIPQYIQAANRLGVKELALLKAVDSVESGGAGFLKVSGRPKILFERHIFRKKTVPVGAWDSTYPNISNTVSGGYLGGEREWDERFLLACTLNETAAILASSWGRFQIMGGNYKVCRYSSPQAYKDAMMIDEQHHLECLVDFLLASPRLITALNNHNWTAFAAGYNGPAYYINHYDIKLEKAYNDSVAAGWNTYTLPPSRPTSAPAKTTVSPTTKAPPTAAPTTKAPTTAVPTTKAPTTAAPTTMAPTTASPTTKVSTTAAPTTMATTTAPATSPATPTPTSPTSPVPTLPTHAAPVPMQYFSLTLAHRLVNTLSPLKKFAGAEVRSYSFKGISPSATAFAAALEASFPVKSGVVTIYSGALTTPPLASSIYYQTGRLSSASVYSALAAGVFKIRSTQSVHVVLDVVGYFAPALGGTWFFATPARRLFDTRSGVATPLTTTARAIKVRGVSLIPLTATAISYTVALPKATGTSKLKVWGSGGVPTTQSGAFNLGLTGQSAGIAPIASDNMIRLATKAATVHAAFDVDGYYSKLSNTIALGFVPLNAPIRLRDTRSTGWHGGSTAVLNVNVRPRLPALAKVLVAVVTALSRNASGSLSVWAQGAAKPATSVLQFNGKLLRYQSLSLNIPLSASGGFSLLSTCAGDLLVDAVGYYMPYNASVTARAAEDVPSAVPSHKVQAWYIVVPVVTVGVICTAALLALVFSKYRHQRNAAAEMPRLQQPLTALD